MAAATGGLARSSPTSQFSSDVRPRAPPSGAQGRDPCCVRSYENLIAVSQHAAHGLFMGPPPASAQQRGRAGRPYASSHRAVAVALGQRRVRRPARLRARVGYLHAQGRRRASRLAPKRPRAAWKTCARHCGRSPRIRRRRASPPCSAGSRPTRSGATTTRRWAISSDVSSRWRSSRCASRHGDSTSWASVSTRRRTCSPTPPSTDSPDGRATEEGGCLAAGPSLPTRRPARGQALVLRLLLLLLASPVGAARSRLPRIDGFGHLAVGALDVLPE